MIDDNGVTGEREVEVRMTGASVAGIRNVVCKACTFSGESRKSVGLFRIELCDAR